MQSSERGSFEKSSKKDCGESGESLTASHCSQHKVLQRELQEPLKWSLNHSSADQEPVLAQARVFLYTPVSEQPATT